ncbi:MAG TPA: DUF5060 domain-containing protein [Chloroflexi bacterium]|nr:DUF5060 domain-containing protein [Chloroflexota bacterium]
MSEQPRAIERRSVGEWAFRSRRDYAHPFADVVVDAIFVGPAGQTFTVPAFYDGDATWRVRFNPNVAGEWRYRLTSRPEDPDLIAEGAFEVIDRDARGFLCATPRGAWGFTYESGEPAFILGDTVYNLFGMAHCGGNVDGFLMRRAEQGVNLLRVRVPVSPFHPPDGYSAWQTRRTWPWGGSEQAPQFDRFALPYFRTVDAVVARAEALGIGLEVIMEGWGFEYPFNRRDVFVPEWEELWMRYLIARYDAYTCVALWTLMNEYEYYPDGAWGYNPVADRWALRMARWVKTVAPHGHIVAVHNGPRMPAFAQRFAQDPDAIDAILFQEWGTRDQELGWLAAGIEEQIVASLAGWGGSALFAEWGYERNPDLPLLIPSHAHCGEDHTRRGGWRGAFCALGIIHGFENSWGPFMVLDEDQPGLAHLLQIRRFFTEIVPFQRLQRAWELASAGNATPGDRPLTLAAPEGDLIVVYLPVGGAVEVALPRGEGQYRARWFNPVSGELLPAEGAGGRFVAPEVVYLGHPQDWVLLLEAE